MVMEIWGWLVFFQGLLVIYKFRHLVENAFCKIKDYRAIATRFDKLKRNFENNVALAFAYQWLKI